MQPHQDAVLSVVAQAHECIVEVDELQSLDDYPTPQRLQIIGHYAHQGVSSVNDDRDRGHTEYDNNSLNIIYTNDAFDVPPFGFNNYYKPYPHPTEFDEHIDNLLQSTTTETTTWDLPDSWGNPWDPCAGINTPHSFTEQVQELNTNTTSIAAATASSSNIAK